jgi:putative ATPase
VLPRCAQRLSALLDLDTLGTELAARVRSAEEAIYTDPADPMVNWDADDLAEFGRAAGLESIQVESHQETAERRITPAELERWFATEGESGRSSYAERLLQAITPAELAQVQVLYERKLEGQVVPWASTTLYLVAR